MTRIETGLCKVLAELSGQNYAAVFSARETSRAIFKSISRDAREFLRESTARDLQKTLVANCAWLKEDGNSPHSSVFVCCDLFSTQSVVSYVTALHSKIERTVKSPTQIRFVPLGIQHCTLFTDQQGPLAPDVPENTFKRYSGVAGQCETFDLVVRGPHLAKDGGIILEIEACSPEPLRIKAQAKAMPPTEGRVVNPIIFSTVGYLLDASIEEARRLWQEFAVERRKQTGMRTRIRGLRVAVSLNRLTVGLPYYLSFRPTAVRSLSDRSAARLLTKLCGLVEQHRMDSLSGEVLLNEVSTWLEHPAGPRSLAAATALFSKCVARKHSEL